MLSRLRQRVLRVLGSPELRPVDAAVLFVFLQVFFTPVFAFLLHTTLQRPDVPVNQVDSLRQAWLVQTRVVIPVNVALLLLALLVRKWSPDNRWLAHLAIQFTMLVGLWGAYLQGLYTHIFSMSVFLALPMLSLALFDVSIVRPAVITFILGALAMTVAEQLRLIPYAPLLPNPPIQTGISALDSSC